MVPVFARVIQLQEGDAPLVGVGVGVFVGVGVRVRVGVGVLVKVGVGVGVIPRQTTLSHPLRILKLKP